MRRKKASTVGFYTDNVENHISPALGSTPIAALTRSQCKTFVLQIEKKELSQSTKIGIAITLGALLSAAVEPGGRSPQSRRRSEHTQEQAAHERQVFRAR